MYYKIKLEISPLSTEVHEKTVFLYLFDKLIQFYFYHCTQILKSFENQVLNKTCLILLYHFCSFHSSKPQKLPSVSQF